MFDPKCHMTPHLIGYFEKIAGEITAFKDPRIKLPVRVNLEADAVARSVHSSTWIEGNTLTLTQVAALAAHQHVTAEADQKKEVQKKESKSGLRN